MGCIVQVLNVERGLSILIRTPNNYAILYDCGSSSEINPAQIINKGNFLEWKNCKLAYLIISHPHSDHITSITDVHALVKPRVILRRANLDWDRVTKSNIESKSMNFYLEKFFPPNDYSETVPSSDMPPWGEDFSIKSFQLPIEKVEEVSSTDNEYVNNSSLVTIVKAKGYTFALTGDIESKGMDVLLETEPGLVNLIKTGVDFYVCPHHGHESGFSEKWFEIAGPTKKFNIVSERKGTKDEADGQTKVDSRYSLESSVLAINRAGRKVVTTRADGTITVEISDDGKWTWQKSR